MVAGLADQSGMGTSVLCYEDEQYVFTAGIMPKQKLPFKFLGFVLASEDKGELGFATGAFLAENFEIELSDIINLV